MDTHVDIEGLKAAAAETSGLRAELREMDEEILRLRASSKATTRATLWVYIRDNGDGSASAFFFNTEADAERAAELDFEWSGQRMCDDVDSVTLEFDDSGVLLNPSKLSDFKE